MKSIHNLVHSKKLNHNISFMGFLPRSELNKHLKKSHVMAVPSVYEGFGIAYLEALGFGLPVIATTAGAAREIITDGREGFLVPPENPATLTKTFSHLIRNRDLLYSMSVNALGRYNDFPTWSESMGKIRDFLISLANKR